ncbi:MAG TPA: amino acid adenylation domain-containing protein [Desulfocapsa sulfexigens]|nr:amino acid adenylation domain-containing protein [Desulfocapsa sulfexigens]
MMNTQKSIPLTHAEQRIYFTQQLYPSSPMWNVPVSLRITLADIERLKEAVLTVVAQTPGLHQVFTVNDGKAYKQIDMALEPKIEMVDFSEQGERAYLEWAEEQAGELLPMLDALSYRIGIADVGDGTAYLFSIFHHILADGTSSDLVFRRILKVYKALKEGESITFPAPPPLETAYEAEQQYVESDDYRQDQKFWHQLFESLPQPLDISGKTASDSITTASCDHRFSKTNATRLLNYCQQNKVSPFRVVLAGMYLVLARTLRRDDIVIGTGTANRYPPELRETIGMFVSTAATRMKVDGEISFDELVSNASQCIRDTLAHQRYPYDTLTADLRQRFGEVPDLTSCTLVEMVRTPYEDNTEAIVHLHTESLIPLAGFLTYPHRSQQNDTKVDLHVVYNESMFEKWRIEEFIAHIEQAVIAGISAPETKVCDIDFLSDTERRKLVYDFNETEAQWEVETTLHQCIDDIVRRFPGHTAVVHRGEKMSYAELDKRSNAMARTLIANGAGPGKVIGLLADRSIDIIVAQLAILKSGSAFMPIDANYPDSRIQFMLEDIAAPLILTQPRFIDEKDFGDALVVNMDDRGVYDTDDTMLDNRNTPNDLCVAIYTSGSTGKPKGVLQEHRAICNTIHATIEDHGITPDDRISKHASFSFDASLLEVFLALMSGAELHIIPEEIRLSLSHLNEYYEEHGITWSFLTTQLGEQFMDFIDNKSLRTLAIGGEKMRIFTPRDYQLLNLYGPTECAIYATQHPVTGVEDNIPIGKPLGNFRMYIVDKFNQPQPPGYGGELCIAGPAVARGYHKREDKTAECFVPDPFYPGETMYRTGDLACWAVDGNILHLGRIDRQVKLRGFRIELGEIENAMLSINDVNEAAVSDFKDSAGHVYLCGYICGDADPDAVTRELDGKVPPFMVPLHMMKLDSMPINPSGKIDRKKLPEPQTTPETEEEYKAPETDLEEKLCSIWAQALSREQISVEANFFNSGGDSLRAVALQVNLEKKLGYAVELAAIFEYPSPRQMAARLTNSEASAAPIPAAKPAEYYPATVSQQQLYLLSRMKGIGTAYNIPLCITFDGPLDQKRLSTALVNLVERHEALRTSFTIKNGVCVQCIADKVHLKLEFSQTDNDDLAILTSGFSRPFDLSRAPLMHAKLVAHTDGRHWLLLDFHHIVFDGVSTGIYLRELFALYNGEPLEPLSIQHKDLAVWEADREEEIKTQHQDFWHNLFDSPPESELPTDFTRPNGQDYAGADYQHQINPDTSAALRQLAKQQGSTLHQIFMTAIGVVGGRWADSNDICIGTSMSGRDKAGTASIVGMFVRTLPTRICPKAGSSFADLLHQTKSQMLAIHEHGEYPISSLYEHLGANRGPGRHPMFDINFVMRNIGAENTFDLGDLKATISAIRSKTAKFDISIAVEEHGSNLVLEIDYRTSLYRRETIARFAGHLCSILEAAAKTPEIPIEDFEILGPEERNALLKQFNPQPTPAPQWQTVCQAIDEHARHRPDHIAVTAENGSLTYGQLVSLANRTARAISKQGGGKDKIVAVIADRTTWPVVGMLAALKSGSAYVGLDTHYPDDRIAFILEDTEAPCVVGTKEQIDTITIPCATVVIDGKLPTDDTDPGLAEGGDALAYCIFTSGSTGKPKGVLIEHHSMVNFIHWYSTHHQMSPASGCAAFAAFSFDVSVAQIFAPLVSGSSLHVIAEDMRRSPQELDDYFVANKITNAHFPTQFAEQFMNMCSGRSLQYMVVGGDRLKSYRMGDYRLTNEYGPSETTMACLSYDVPEVTAKPPVGSPVANTRVYILDSRERLCPIGVPGEICVAGTQVGRGYLNRKDLTDKHFVDDPFHPGERMFRTGDKGKWLDDGTVDFIGRIDFQVKIRGYRVEPGEIESRIKEMDKVIDCVVVPLEEPSGNKVLAAYFSGQSELESGSMKSRLQTTLPDYMVPAHFVQLEKLPLNPNGKIDRSKLPRPEITAHTAGPIEPRNPIEAQIAKAWEQVLGHRGFGLFDSFYDIGGDSLNAIALLANLSETFDISASDLFAHTTIAEQANHFQEAEIGRSARLLRLKEMAAPPDEDDVFNEELAFYDRNCSFDEALDTDSVRKINHVLLTGGTGTLGIYLIRELLLSTDAHITTIVRAKDDQTAYQRLDDHYHNRFQRHLADDSDGRLEVMTGDLTVAGFGMEKKVYSRLEAEVDTILHSAALTSHYGEWDVFVSANISSVKNLADFARKGIPKAMHHISTTSIGAGFIEGRSKSLFTEFDIDKGQQSGNNYVRSKLLAETVLEKLRSEGLPVNVYRAGNIACDSETGVFQRNVEDNAFYQQIRAYVNLGAAPDFTDVRNISYVDQSAKAIVTLMTRPGLAGQTFHIHNPQLLSLSEALSDPAINLRIQRLPFNTFIDFFAEHAGCPGFDEYIERMLLHLGWQDWLSTSERTDTVIRVERTATLLERCGFVWKNPQPQDLQQFISHALQDRAQKLATIPGFTSLDTTTLTAISARIKPEYYSEGSLLQQEKTEVDGVRILMEGMVETYRHNINGWIGTVRVGGPGACTGEEAVPEDAEAINSVEALDDSYGFQLSLEDVRSLTMQHPKLGLALLQLANIKTDQAERLFVAV